MAFGKITFDPEEDILAELSPRRGSLFFPVLELLLITAVVWILVGLIDGYFDSEAMVRLGYKLNPPSELASSFPEPVYEGMLWLRRGLLVLWVWLAWRRCIRHMIFRTRSRILLTNERLITVSGHWRSHTAQVPLYNVVDARSKGSKVQLFTMGARNPIVLTDVPYSKRFVRLIRENTRAL